MGLFGLTPISSVLGVEEGRHMGNDWQLFPDASNPGMVTEKGSKLKSTCSSAKNFPCTVPVIDSLVSTVCIREKAGQAN